MEKKMFLVTLRLSEDCGQGYPEGKLKAVEVVVKDQTDAEEIKDFIRAAYELDMCDMWEIVSVEDSCGKSNYLDRNGNKIKIGDCVKDTKDEHDGIVKGLSEDKLLLFGMGEWLGAGRFIKLR